jgi:hypothetical protein
MLWNSDLKQSNRSFFLFASAYWAHDRDSFDIALEAANRCGSRPNAIDALGRRLCLRTTWRAKVLVTVEYRIDPRDREPFLTAIPAGLVTNATSSGVGCGE